MCYLNEHQTLANGIKTVHDRAVSKVMDVEIIEFFPVNVRDPVKE